MHEHPTRPLGELSARRGQVATTFASLQLDAVRFAAIFDTHSISVNRLLECPSPTPRF